MLFRIRSHLGDFTGLEILGKGWGLEGVDGSVCASSSPIQHIWNIWALEVCSNAERHSETHKETFSSSPVFCYKPVALYIEKKTLWCKSLRDYTLNIELEFVLTPIRIESVWRSVCLSLNSICEDLDDLCPQIKQVWFKTGWVIFAGSQSSWRSQFGWFTWWWWWWW